MKNRPLISMLVQPSPIIIPATSELRRAIPRPAEQRQSNYEELFDDRTLFYDAFHTVEGITLCGPPLSNLKGGVESAAIFVDGKKITDASFEDMDRTQRSYIRADPGATALRLEMPGLAAETAIGANHSGVFAGRKVLFTKSKNNNLKWIKDWTIFHAREHGIDAVLVYDNGSTDYSAKDVLRAVSDVDGIAAAVVVTWPFPFGPQGGSGGGVQNAPWDSDFCEYGIMEHARRRFLTQAAGVVNADIDELVIRESGGTVFDELEASGAGVLLYAGRWIEALGATGGSVPRFTDFRFYNVDRAKTTMKWTANPARIRAATQWKTHYVHGVNVTTTEAVLHRHFEGITSRWKRQGGARGHVDPAKHRVDSRLVEAMNRAFGARLNFKTALSRLAQRTGSKA